MIFYDKTIYLLLITTLPLSHTSLKCLQRWPKVLLYAVIIKTSLIYRSTRTVHTLKEAFPEALQKHCFDSINVLWYYSVRNGVSQYISTICMRAYSSVIQRALGIEYETVGNTYLKIICKIIHNNRLTK